MNSDAIDVSELIDMLQNGMDRLDVPQYDPSTHSTRISFYEIATEGIDLDRLRISSIAAESTGIDVSLVVESTFNILANFVMMASQDSIEDDRTVRFSEGGSKPKVTAYMLEWFKEFVVMALKELRARVCSQPSRAKKNNAPSVISSSIATAIAAAIASKYHISMVPAVGIGVPTILAIISGTHGAFCEMTEQEVLEAIARRVVVDSLVPPMSAPN
jgi:hypothetical protein